MATENETKELESLREEVAKLKRAKNDGVEAVACVLGAAFISLVGLGLASIEQKERDSRRKNRSFIDRIF